MPGFLLLLSMLLALASASASASSTRAASSAASSASASAAASSATNAASAASLASLASLSAGLRPDQVPTSGVARHATASSKLYIQESNVADAYPAVLVPMMRFDLGMNTTAVLSMNHSSRFMHLPRAHLEKLGGEVLRLCGAYSNALCECQLEDREGYMVCRVEEQRRQEYLVRVALQVGGYDRKSFQGEYGLAPKAAKEMLRQVAGPGSKVDVGAITEVRGPEAESGLVGSFVRVALVVRHLHSAEAAERVQIRVKELSPVSLLARLVQNGAGAGSSAVVLSAFVEPEAERDLGMNLVHSPLLNKGFATERARAEAEGKLMDKMDAAARVLAKSKAPKLPPGHPFFDHKAHNASAAHAARAAAAARARLDLDVDEEEAQKRTRAMALSRHWRDCFLKGDCAFQAGGAANGTGDALAANATGAGGARAPVAISARMQLVGYSPTGFGEEPRIAFYHAMVKLCGAAGVGVEDTTITRQRDASKDQAGPAVGIDFTIMVNNSAAVKPILECVRGLRNGPDAMNVAPMLRQLGASRTSEAKLTYGPRVGRGEAATRTFGPEVAPERDQCDATCYSTRFGNYTTCYADCEVAQCIAAEDRYHAQLADLREQDAEVRGLLATNVTVDGDSEAEQQRRKGLELQLGAFAKQRTAASKGLGNSTLCVTKWNLKRSRWAKEEVLEKSRLMNLRARKLFAGQLSHLQDSALSRRLQEVNATLARLRDQYLVMTGEEVADAEGDAAAARVLRTGVAKRGKLSGRLQQIDHEIQRLDERVVDCSRMPISAVLASGAKGAGAMSPSEREANTTCSGDSITHMRKIRVSLVKEQRKVRLSWSKQSECGTQHAAARAKLKVLEQHLHKTTSMQQTIAASTGRLPGGGNDDLPKSPPSQAEKVLTRRIARLERDIGVVGSWVNATAARADPHAFPDARTPALQRSVDIARAKMQAGSARLSRCLNLVRGTPLFPALEARLRDEGGLDIGTMKGGADGPVPSRRLDFVCQRIMRGKHAANKVLQSLIEASSEVAAAAVTSGRRGRARRGHAGAHGGLARRQVEAATSDLLMNIEVSEGGRASKAGRAAEGDSAALAQVSWELERVTELLRERKARNKGLPLPATAAENADLYSLQLVQGRLEAELARTASMDGTAVSHFRFSEVNMQSQERLRVGAGMKTREGMAEEASISAASKLSVRSVSELLNVTMSCLCFDAGTGGGRDSWSGNSSLTSGACGDVPGPIPVTKKFPVTPIFPLSQLPDEASELAKRMRREAVERVSEMEKKLEEQQKALMRESRRRVRVSREQARADIEELRKQRLRIEEERHKFGVWQQHRIRLDKLAIAEQVATYNVTVVELRKKQRRLEEKRAEQAKKMLMKQEAAMKKRARQREEEAKKIERFRLERLEEEEKMRRRQSNLDHELVKHNEEVIMDEQAFRGQLKKNAGMEETQKLEQMEKERRLKSKFEHELGDLAQEVDEMRDGSNRGRAGDPDVAQVKIQAAAAMRFRSSSGGANSNYLRQNGMPGGGGHGFGGPSPAYDVAVARRQPFDLARSERESSAAAATEDDRLDGQVGAGGSYGEFASGAAMSRFKESRAPLTDKAMPVGDPSVSGGHPPINAVAPPPNPDALITDKGRDDLVTAQKLGAWKHPPQGDHMRGNPKWQSELARGMLRGGPVPTDTRFPKYWPDYKDPMYASYAWKDGGIDAKSLSDSRRKALKQKFEVPQLSMAELKTAIQSGLTPEQAAALMTSDGLKEMADHGLNLEDDGDDARGKASMDKGATIKLAITLKGMSAAEVTSDVTTCLKQATAKLLSTGPSTDTGGSGVDPADVTVVPPPTATSLTVRRRRRLLADVRRRTGALHRVETQLEGRSGIAAGTAARLSIAARTTAGNSSVSVKVEVKMKSLIFANAASEMTKSASFGGDVMAKTMECLSASASAATAAAEKAATAAAGNERNDTLPRFKALRRATARLTGVTAEASSDGVSTPKNNGGQGGIVKFLAKSMETLTDKQAQSVLTPDERKECSLNGLSAAKCAKMKIRKSMVLGAIKTLSAMEKQKCAKAGITVEDCAWKKVELLVDKYTNKDADGTSSKVAKEADEMMGYFNNQFDEARRSGDPARIRAAAKALNKAQNEQYKIQCASWTTGCDAARRSGAQMGVAQQQLVLAERGTDKEATAAARADVKRAEADLAKAKKDCVSDKTFDAKGCGFQGCEEERKARQRVIRAAEKNMTKAEITKLTNGGMSPLDVAWKKVENMVHKMTPNELRSIGLLEGSWTLEQEDGAFRRMVVAKMALGGCEGTQCEEAVKRDMDTLTVEQMQQSGILSNDLNSVALTAEAEAASCAVKADRAKMLLEKERQRLEEERRRWEEAVVRLARPKTCRQLLGLATGGRDGVYTVFPPEHSQLGQASGCQSGNGKAYSPACNRMYHGVEVFCDMMTDNGGWTLVAYAERGRLGGRLTTAHGKYSPLERSGSANVNAVWLSQASSEMAISWNNQPLVGASSPNLFPAGGIGSYDTAIKFDIPNAGDQTLSPPEQMDQMCDSPHFVATTVTCLQGNCNMPKKMYTGVDSLGVCGGRAYGVARSASGPKCDFRIDSDNNQGVFIGIDDSARCAGVADLKRTKDRASVPITMAIWVR